METLVLEKSDRFKDELKVIIDFIAQDSVTRALEFYDELIYKVQNIPENPYLYRARYNSQDKYTRELIFKGYTIPFEIDMKNHKIIILGIFNQNLWG
ncbi:MAG: type II toxin-antitoxin system RelE/ParE family toxin [Arcobacteraceae bacterium]